MQTSGFMLGTAKIVFIVGVNSMGVLVAVGVRVDVAVRVGVGVGVRVLVGVGERVGARVIVAAGTSVVGVAVSPPGPQAETTRLNPTIRITEIRCLVFIFPTAPFWAHLVTDIVSCPTNGQAASLITLGLQSLYVIP
jgi:hypothetical protein